MDSIKLFRALVQASLALLAVSIAISFFGDELPEEVTAYLDGEAAGPLSSALLSERAGVQIAVGALMMAYLVAWIASMLGLLGFRPWARTGFIALTVAGFPLLLVAGSSLMSPLEGTLEALLNTCSGAILALLFTEPVRSAFAPRV
jgi:hypothetical protein